MNDYKFQVSKTDGKGGIYVARSNESLEDCVLDIEKVLVISEEKAVAKVAEVVKNDHFCVKHNTQMKERSFNGRVWYDHRRKNGEEWEQCSGHGFGSELKEAVDNSFGQ